MEEETIPVDWGKITPEQFLEAIKAAQEKARLARMSWNDKFECFKELR